MYKYCKPAVKFQVRPTSLSQVIDSQPVWDGISPLPEGVSLDYVFGKKDEIAVKQDLAYTAKRVDVSAYSPIQQRSELQASFMSKWQ